MRSQSTSSSGPQHTDVKLNRRSQKWSRTEQLGRILWTIAWPLFVLSPRPLWFWRRWLLRLFGAKVGQDARVFPTVRITIPWHLTLGAECAVGDRATLYCLGPVTVGARTTISQGAHVCAGTHDWRRRDMPLLKLPVVIGVDVWVAADAFVGPGVTIGDRAIVGARAVAMRSLAEDTIAIGNPACVVSRRNKNQD